MTRNWSMSRKGGEYGLILEKYPLRYELLQSVTDKICDLTRNRSCRLLCDRVIRLTDRYTEQAAIVPLTRDQAAAIDAEFVGIFEEDDD